MCGKCYIANIPEENLCGLLQVPLKHLGHIGHIKITLFQCNF